MEATSDDFLIFEAEFKRLGGPAEVLIMPAAEIFKSQWGPIYEKAFNATPFVQEIVKNSPFSSLLLSPGMLEMMVSFKKTMEDLNSEGKKELGSLSDFPGARMRRVPGFSGEIIGRLNDPPSPKLRPGKHVDDIRFELLDRMRAEMARGTQMTKAIKKVLHLVPGDASDESKIKWFERELRKPRHPSH